MKKLIALIIGCAVAVSALAQDSTNNAPAQMVEQTVTNHVFLPKVITGDDMAVIMPQELSVTNSAGQSVLGNINVSDINSVNIQVIKTNGVPQKLIVRIR